MDRRIVFLTLWLCFSLYLQAQTSRYPQGYFRNPLDIPLSLAANFGELRPNHWHMGLDIRTGAKENLPVYAAAEGFISHIGIRPQSFGRFIIIEHPNGMSTLYGHLNDFFPGLEDYVTSLQYQKESWALELDLKPGQFPVTKGAFIAYSGNTGGSQGPHLHFEIFDTKSGKRFNPLLLGFDIGDNVKPTMVKLAIYDGGLSTYRQSPQYLNIKKTDSGYIVPKSVVVKTGFEKVSLAIQAYDKMTASGSVDGIFGARLFLDGEKLSYFELDNISYEETINIEAQIDHELRYNGGSFLQRLNPLPNDRSSVYHLIKDGGLVWLKDTSVHTVKIEVYDVYGNTAFLEFKLQRDESLVKADKNLPEEMLVPGKATLVERNGFEAWLSSTALYDTIPLIYYRNNSYNAMALSAVHTLNDPSIPLHDDLLIRLKPERPVPFEWQDKLVIQRTDRKGSSVKKATWEEKWLAAKFGDMGNFQLMADTSSPYLAELGKADTVDLSPAGRIVFTPADNLSGVRKFRAELDGRWLRFTNDKGRSWIYVFDERCPYGVHELKVTVEDQVGNSTTKSWWFKRYPYTPPKKKAVKTKSRTKKGVKTVKKKKK